jgi:very-short-patch-repair endonuclease
MRQPKIHNKGYLKETRIELRNNPTLPEARLWRVLKERQINGRKFRRQHSIEDYVVDFYCPAEKLVIELDGGIHNNIGAQAADFERDKRLKELGFKVLRIKNEQLINNIEYVIEEIKQSFTKGS